MLNDAYANDFPDSDWDHALGGTHFFIATGGESGNDNNGEKIISHVSVVGRELVADGASFRTGYLEAVATSPEFRRRGHATSLIAKASAFIRERRALGGLCTGEYNLYARLGWERWRGETFVRDGGRQVRTPEADDALMVLRFGESECLDLSAPISCDWREGDVW